MRGGVEHYEFTWPGKKKSIQEANIQISKTIRPCIEDSKDWQNTKNLYIEGDNLEALKILQESYLEKIDIIYIDPPYNTGKDFLYKDDFSQSSAEYSDSISQNNESGEKLFKNTESNGKFHSDWCSMIYPRLLLARTLLADGGLIFISIDDNEQGNLKKISDEVFGEHNCVNTFIWNCSTAGGIRPKFASKTHEYVLCYAKNINSLPSFWANLSTEALKLYKKRDAKGIYREKDFIFRNKSSNQNQKYVIECPDGELVKPKDGYIYRFIKSQYENALRGGLVVFKKTKTGPLIKQDGGQSNWNIYIKKYLKEGKGAPSTLIPKEVTDFTLLPKKITGMYNEGTSCLQKIFNDKRVFENVKTIGLLSYLLNLSCNKNAVILDFFSGSATTAHAVMQLNAEDGGNRQFIMVQLPEKCDEKSEAFKAGYKNICEIGKERIRRAGEQIKKDHLEAKVDIGFRVFKVDSSNMKDVYYNPELLTQELLSSLESNIKEDRSDLDLLFGCILDLGLTLEKEVKEETIGDTKVYIYNDDEKEGPDLIACFADNITEDVITAIAKRNPLKAVFKDSSFENSPSKINLFELFKTYANISDDNELQSRVRVI